MKIKYWLKMKIAHNEIDNWIMKCEKLGEVKLVGYISSTFNIADGLWHYDKYKKQAIMQLLELSEATIFNYLKNLCKNGILIKKGKGVYQLNPEYIEFGSKIK